MTTEEKAKAYEMALEAARKELGVDRKEWEVVQRVLHNIFPQLRESEDEKVRKCLIAMVNATIWDSSNLASKKACLAWLEKQKEPENVSASTMAPSCWAEEPSLQKEDKDELVYRLNGLMQDYIKEGKDDEEKEHRFKCYQLFWDALEDTNFFEQKEQKPVEIHNPTDEEVESWENELTEFKRFATKQAKENQLHISYTRDIMWENFCSELLSFVNSRKPAEWSEEDTLMLTAIIQTLERFGGRGTTGMQIDWLKSLRPDSYKNCNSRWKPSEEQMKALQNAVALTACDKELARLYNQLKKL